jgi:hypothetical protein
MPGAALQPNFMDEMIHAAKNNMRLVLQYKTGRMPGGNRGMSRGREICRRVVAAVDKPEVTTHRPKDNAYSAAGFIGAG